MIFVVVCLVGGNHSCCVDHLDLTPSRIHHGVVTCIDVVGIKTGSGAAETIGARISRRPSIGEYSEYFVLIGGVILFFFVEIV